MNWIELTDNATLVDLQNTSNSTPLQFVIFKHSTRCSTSRMALKLFEENWREVMPAYKVNVVENRTVSNEVEKIFRVRHESPQVLVIRNGKCIFNASHSMIEAAEVMSLVVSE